MGENEFEFEGKTFIAVESNLECDGCAFDGFFCNLDWKSYPACMAGRRHDKKEVIFVEKQE